MPGELLPLEMSHATAKLTLFECVSETTATQNDMAIRHFGHQIHHRN